MAIQGLRKGCHSSHHTAQLPGLNLASESLQEAVGVPADLLDPQIPPQGPLLLQGGSSGYQGCSHGLWVPAPRAGPGYVTEAPEATPPRPSGVLCSGPCPGWLWPLVPRSLLCPPGSALTQFFLLGPGSLSEEPLLLLLLSPAVTRSLSPWRSADSLCLTLLLLTLLGMFPGQAIRPGGEGLRFLGLTGNVIFKPPHDLLPLVLQLSLQLLPPLPLLGGLIFFLLFSRIPGGSPAQNLPRCLPILILYSHGRWTATQQWQEEVCVGIRALAGSSVQCCVPMAVLVGRVSPQPKKQAQGRGIMAGTGPVEWWGLPSIYIKAWVSLEEGLGPDQPSCRQITTKATFSTLAAGSGGHGTLGPAERRRGFSHWDLRGGVTHQTCPPPTYGPPEL